MADDKNTGGYESVYEAAVYEVSGNSNVYKLKTALLVAITTLYNFWRLNGASVRPTKLAVYVEDYCCKVINVILSAPAAMQRAVLGRVYSFTPEEKVKKIDELFKAASEVEHYSLMLKNVVTFLTLMVELWKDYEVSG